MDRIDLDGQTAIVTGGAQGIGRAIAERLTADGARVIIWDRDIDLATETAKAIGGHAALVDIADPTAIVAAAADAGPIDILINNAGIAGPTTKLWEYPIDAWRSIVEIDLNGVFYCCRAVVPGMIARNYGRIVNVASIAGKEGNPNAAAYSAAKAGVIALTKSLGKELAGHDIAVNCITPATAQTRILEQVSESHVAYMLSRIPRGRFLKVEEAAAVVAWLCSKENTFTTAATFDLSGGRATY
jgi:NAD(P)-dependent dehydrogenase (short-subunit alcohol dehydrogenase family)